MSAECLSSEREAGKNEAVLSEFENLSIGNGDQELLPEIEHESVLDGELGKRLNQMVPVPVSLHFFCGYYYDRLFHVKTLMNQFIMYIYDAVHIIDIKCMVVFVSVAACSQN